MLRFWQFLKCVSDKYNKSLQNARYVHQVITLSDYWRSRTTTCLSPYTTGYPFATTWIVSHPFFCLSLSLSLSVRERLVILFLSIKSFYALACSSFVTFCACVWVIMLFCYLNLYNVCMFYVIKFFQVRFSLLPFIWLPFPHFSSSNNVITPSSLFM